MTLPTDSKGREEWPIWDYFFGYFPDAFLAEVQVSWEGNKQHNPGQRMHWAREKSKDHLNKAMRHQLDYGKGVKKDTDGCWHLAKAIWRLKAQLQLDIEAERERGTPGTIKIEPLAPAPAPVGDADDLLEKFRKQYEEKAVPGQVFPWDRPPFKRGGPDVYYVSQRGVEHAAQY